MPQPQAALSEAPAQSEPTYSLVGPYSLSLATVTGALFQYGEPDERLHEFTLDYDVAGLVLDIDSLTHVPGQAHVTLRSRIKLGSRVSEPLYFNNTFNLMNATVESYEDLNLPYCFSSNNICSAAMGVGFVQRSSGGFGYIEQNYPMTVRLVLECNAADAGRPCASELEYWLIGVDADSAGGGGGDGDNCPIGDWDTENLTFDWLAQCSHCLPESTGGGGGLIPPSTLGTSTPVPPDYTPLPPTDIPPPTNIPPPTPIGGSTPTPTVPAFTPTPEPVESAFSWFYSDFELTYEKTGENSFSRDYFIWDWEGQVLGNSGLLRGLMFEVLSTPHQNVSGHSLEFGGWNEGVGDFDWFMSAHFHDEYRAIFFESALVYFSYEEKILADIAPKVLIPAYGNFQPMASGPVRFHIQEGTCSESCVSQVRIWGVVETLFEENHGLPPSTPWSEGGGSAPPPPIGDGVDCSNPEYRDGINGDGDPVIDWGGGGIIDSYEGQCFLLVPHVDLDLGEVVGQELQISLPEVAACPIWHAIPEITIAEIDLPFKIIILWPLALVIMRAIWRL